jgi:hypothetical protein
VIVQLALLTALALQEPSPSGTLILQEGARTTRLTSVRVRVQLTSPGAGDVQMSVTVEGQPQAAWSPFQEVSFLDLPGGDGEKKVTLRLRDRKGAESTPVSAAIRLDTVPPVVKVEAPDHVSGSELRLTLESADAVGMQYTEDIASWSAWEAFSTPKTIALSKGAGAKQVFVRFRDEAGNETIPARLRVEAQDPNAPAAPDGIRSLSLAVRRNVDNLELSVWVYGSGLQEIQAELDKVEVLARIPFVPSWKAQLAPSPGPRRLVVKAWDGVGREHRAEAIFQEQDVPAAPPPEEVSPPWRVDLLAGVLPGGIEFHSSTVVGQRRIERRPMPIVRLQGATDIGAQLYVQLAVEVAAGSDVRVFSGGADFGIRMNLGRWDDVKFQLRAEAGIYYSQLEVASAGFGDFRGAILARVGAALGVEIVENLWTELLVDFRWAQYPFKEEILSSNAKASGWGGAAMLGLSWRF